jgi:hypothetical protein
VENAADDGAGSSAERRPAVKKWLKQEITGYHMPMYLNDILTGNYNRNFLRMSIIKDGDAYMFSYDTADLRKIKTGDMTLHEKMQLIRGIIEISEENDNHLVMARKYLLEPELIYSRNNSVTKERLKLLFYPDFNEMEFEDKLILFIDRITDMRKETEVKEMEDLKEMVLKGDRLRLLRYLDKRIVRLDPSVYNSKK